MEVSIPTGLHQLGTVGRNAVCSQDLLNPYSWQWLLSDFILGLPSFPSVRTTGRSRTVRDQLQLPHQLNGSVSHTPVHHKNALQVHDASCSLRGHVAICYVCSATSSRGGSKSAVWDEPKCLMMTCAACRFNDSSIYRPQPSCIVHSGLRGLSSS